MSSVGAIGRVVSRLPTGIQTGPLKGRHTSISRGQQPPQPGSISKDDPVDHEVAELIQTVDPHVLGARIKTARIAAGLRQHQLAEGVSSVPYISRIEAGARRPGLDLLAVIAERTKTSVAALLRGLPDSDVVEIELELNYAQLEISTGSAAVALDRLAAVADRFPEEFRGPLAQRARRLHADALEATGDLSGAIAELELLLDSGADAGSWVSDATALSRCYREAGQLRSAIEIGDRARSRLVSVDLEGSTDGIRLSLTIAAALFERGDIADAIDVCTRAIGHADKLGDPIAKASAYWNASIIEGRQGNHAAALEYARAAIPIIEAADDARDVARLRIQLGILLLRSGDASGARATLREVLGALETSAASSADLTDARIALAEAEFELGNSDIAQRLLDAVGSGDADAAPLVGAERAILRGRIQWAIGAADSAIAHYRDALAILTGITADRFVGEIWFELASLFDEVGDTDQAQIAYRAAAASAGFAARTGARLSASSQQIS